MKRPNVLLLLGLAAALLAPAGAQVPEEPRGILGRDVPEPSTSGEWHGTWWYVNRDAKIALWIRTQDGLPQMKLRYLNIGDLEGFETDWEGDASYVTHIGNGTFKLVLGERDANRIEGSWEWRLRAKVQTRVETARFHVYRINDGRQLSLVFDKLERHVERDGMIEDAWKAAPVFTFGKASKRLVLWDELPF